MDDAFALLDWKRRVFALYQSVRSAADPEAAWSLWREGRDDLFRTHPQSPLPEAERGDFTGLQYFDYDAAAACARRGRAGRAGAAADRGEWRPVASCSAASRPPRFELDGEQRSLDLHWLEGYGGGIFLAFADATSGSETYGGGRYVLDS